MPRKRSVSRKKKGAPTTTTIADDTDDNPEEEEQQERNLASSSSEENNKELAVATEEETTTIKEKSTSSNNDDTMMNDDNGSIIANNTSFTVLDPNDHDLSSGDDEGKEDEINHPTTSPLFRRRPSTTNKQNNRQLSSPTSPSSPSTLSPTKTTTIANSSNNTTSSIVENNVTESQGNTQNSQDVLIKKRTTRRKPLQSPTTNSKKQSSNNTSSPPSSPNNNTTSTTLEKENTTVEDNISTTNNEAEQQVQSETSIESSSTSTAAASDDTTSIVDDDKDTNNKMMEDDEGTSKSSTEKDDDSDEVICETPKKSRNNRRGRTATTQKSNTNTEVATGEEKNSTTKEVASEAPSSSSSSSSDEKEMDTTEDTTVKRTPKRSRIKNVKRKAASSESESDEESTKSQSKQRKLDARPQRRRGMETPVSQRGNPATPQPSPGLARPRKLDVSKKLLILKGNDLKNLSSLKKKVTSAINEAKKAVNKASPKRPDSDVSRLSGNLTDLDFKLLTDESISTGTVTLIDGTSQSNKRTFRDTEEYDEFKEFRDGTMIQIPIPNIRVIEEAPVGPPFTRTSEFIKYEDPDRYDRSTLTLNPIPPQAEFDMYSHRMIDISVEYNMESEDEEWLNNYNKESRYPLSEKDFESIIALMNRASKNGKSCWFSVASVIELSRFFDIRLEERHIVQVKKLWETKYNPQHKLFKNEELQKRIDNENLLYEYMCVRQQLNSYKEQVENVIDISKQQKDLMNKHLKQMNRKNYSVSKDFPKFVTKYSKLTHDEEIETNLEANNDNSNMLEDTKDTFPADQVEIELFMNEEKKEDERKKANQKVRKLWKHRRGDDNQDDESTLDSSEFNSSSNEAYSPPNSTSSLASLIIPPLPPIVTKNLSNIQTESTSSNIETPTSAISNSDDLHASKRRTRKKRMDSGTPTSNVSRTPTSASAMDFQTSFDESSSHISSPTHIVPPILDASSPLPSPNNNNNNNTRRRKKHSKTVIN